MGPWTMSTAVMILHPQLEKVSQPENSTVLLAQVCNNLNSTKGRVRREMCVRVYSGLVFWFPVGNCVTLRIPC